jgi:hypothetical protein
VNLPKVESGITPSSPHIPTRVYCGWLSIDQWVIWPQTPNKFRARMSVDGHNLANIESPKLAHRSRNQVFSNSRDCLDVCILVTLSVIWPTTCQRPYLMWTYWRDVLGWGAFKVWMSDRLISDLQQNLPFVLTIPMFVVS